MHRIIRTVWMASPKKKKNCWLPIDNGLEKRNPHRRPKVLRGRAGIAAVSAAKC